MNRSIVASLSLLVIVGIAAFSATTHAQQRAMTPQQAVDDLLAADRAFAAASAKTTAIPGLSAMFAADMQMMLGPAGIAKGSAAAIEALKGNPNNHTGRVEWTPVRGGISADGLQGFTLGYTTLYKADGGTVPGKYMTYWVKGADGWRAAAFKRAPRNEGTPTKMSLPPSLPAKMVEPKAVTQALKDEVVAVEKAFSDEAQKIGLGPAFAKFGAADASNFGGPEIEFVWGAEAISKNVERPSPGRSAPGSPVTWSCETPIVASSGDLAVSIGYIKSNAPADANRPPSPFFTIWRKVDGVWRYIAE